MIPFINLRGFSTSYVFDALTDDKRFIEYCARKLSELKEIEAIPFVAPLVRVIYTC